MNITVYGFYYKNNIGDDLFIDAFKLLFPNYNFTFVNRLTSSSLTDTDAVIFGGGSFLFAQPNVDDLELLKTKKIFYIGVGIENDIHPIHLELMKQARLIATRSNDQVERIKEINPNTMYIPDLVYALQPLIQSIAVKPKSVLVIPNILVVPKWNDLQWKTSSWNYFKSEFAQFLDLLVEDNYHLSFYSMCNNKTTDDNFASAEIINAMNYRNHNYNSEYYPSSSFEDITEIFSQYEIIITQRFHGIVLSEMTRRPYLAIHHHDKLKHSLPHEGQYISYYGSFKQELWDKFHLARNMKYSLSQPISLHIFEELKEKVQSLL